MAASWLASARAFDFPYRGGGWGGWMNEMETFEPRSVLFTSQDEFILHLLPFSSTKEHPGPWFSIFDLSRIGRCLLV